VVNNYERVGIIYLHLKTKYYRASPGLLRGDIYLQFRQRSSGDSWHIDCELDNPFVDLANTNVSLWTMFDLRNLWLEDTIILG
jgi:hypothetical protein